MANFILSIICLNMVARTMANDDLSSDFAAWSAKHNKVYSSAAERFKHEAIFNETKAMLGSLLNDPIPGQGPPTYQLALNEFADMPLQELSQNRLGRLKGHLHEPVPDQEPILADAFDLRGAPSELDWTARGAVTPVKNQGSCGGCWAFSAIGAIESRYYIKFNSSAYSRDFSEQHLIDCSSSYGNGGCNGGLSMNAYKYVRNYGGVNKESTYPYRARTSSCYASSSDKNAPLSGSYGYVRVKQNSDAALISALQSGPVSVSVAVGLNYDFYYFKSGIFTCRNKPSFYDLDHEVLAVGYGSNYWIIKNSWGSTWGRGGYIYIARSSNDPCGILLDPIYPTLA